MGGQCDRGDRKHGSYNQKCQESKFLNQENIFQSLFFFIPIANRRFLQKTTWATIMSRNDKTRLMQYLLNKKHANSSVKCNLKSPYILCIGIYKDIGHF